MTQTNLEMYTDPVNYDRESGPFKPEGSSLLLKAAAQASGPILELGCGTGRLTIPLAEQGYDMTGIEIVPEMIQHAQNKAGDLPIRWVCESVCNFQLDSRFALIFAKGLVFQYLLQRAEQEAMLQRVREHLAPGGGFIFDVGFKHPKSMANMTEAQEWYSFIDDRGRKIQVSGTDEYDHHQQIWVQTLYRRWQEGNKEKQAPPVRFALRYFMPQEIEALLYYNGFNVQSRYGDWEGNPLTEESFLQIYACTPRE